MPGTREIVSPWSRSAKRKPGNRLNETAIRVKNKVGQHPLLESGTRGRANGLHHCETIVSRPQPEGNKRAKREKAVRTTERSAEVGVEPGQGALDDVAAVFGAREHVAFVFVDYELRFDTEGF